MSRKKERRKKAERVAWWAAQAVERRAAGYGQSYVPAWSPNGIDYDTRFYELRDGLWYRKNDAECAKHGKVWKDQSIIGIMGRRRRKG